MTIPPTDKARGATPPTALQRSDPDFVAGTSLAFVGGFVDAAAFVALGGLFTSHVTGTFVNLGEAAFTGPSAGWARLLVLPVFVLGVGAGRLVESLCRRRGVAVLRPLLLLEAALLAAFLAAGEAAPPHLSAPVAALRIGLLAVAAMGVQNAIGRLVLAHLPATTVMTVNVAQATIDMLDAWGPPGTATTSARTRLRRSGPAIAAFAFGAVAGAGGVIAGSYAATAVAIVVLLALTWRQPRAPEVAPRAA